MKCLKLKSLVWLLLILLLKVISSTAHTTASTDYMLRGKSKSYLPALYVKLILHCFTHTAHFGLM